MNIEGVNVQFWQKLSPITVEIYGNCDCHTKWHPVYVNERKVYIDQPMCRPVKCNGPSHLLVARHNPDKGALKDHTLQTAHVNSLSVIHGIKFFVSFSNRLLLLMFDYLSTVSQSEQLERRKARAQNKLNPPLQDYVDAAYEIKANDIN